MCKNTLIKSAFRPTVFSLTSKIGSFTTLLLEKKGILQIIMYTYLMTNGENQMKPIKIAICDDEKTLREILRQEIEKHCKNAGILCQINDYDSGERLLILPAENIPDILLLDIQMPGKNGMQTARELRRKNENMILIFVTALSEYVYDAFDVNAFHYLVKPFTDEKLREVLNRALLQYERQMEIATLRQQALTVYQKESVPTAGTDSKKKWTGIHEQITPPAILVKRGGLSTKVLLSDIVYAEVFNRKIMLHTVNGDIEYYGKLTDLSEQTGADFYRTHRSYLVNLKYVEKYNADTVWLEQGIVPMSKKQFSGFVRQYMQYIRRISGKGADR